MNRPGFGFVIDGTWVLFRFLARIYVDISARALGLLRPIYHMRHSDNPALTNSYDLLYNGTEISTGAQREHRVDILETQAAEKGLSASDLEHYLDFFRHGVPPYGGFGMGLARVMMLMLGQSSIRETVFVFRGPNRLLP